LSVTLFEKMPILRALASIELTTTNCYQNNQLQLFD
jgi:hypothetical protein